MREAFILDTNALPVLRRILSSVRGVVGTDAYEAMFRYAAAAEGKRLVNGAASLPEAIATLDKNVGQSSRIVDSSDRLRVHILSSPFLDEEDRSTEALAIGLLQGVVSKHLGGTVDGYAVEIDEPGARGLLVEFRTTDGDDHD